MSLQSHPRQGSTAQRRLRMWIEQLETRLVPSQLPSGTILVATQPNANPDDLSAIVAVDPHTGAQTLVSSGGGFVGPIDLREGSDGQLYVLDYPAGQNGTVFRVDPDTGAQTVVSTGGVFVAPSGIQPIGHHIYLADFGTSTTNGDIVSVDAATGAQRIVASGGDLVNPDALAPGPSNSLYVVDAAAFTTGAVFQIDIRTGAQRLIATGGYVDESGAITTTTTLAITHTTFRNNVARGGDNAGVGNAFGAAFTSLADTTTISHSTFHGNRTLGGNGRTGQFVGDAQGGAMSIGGTVSLVDSMVDHNEALAGSGGNSGPGAADPAVDISYGGAISDSFGGILSVTSSTISHNEALGGTGNTGDIDLVGLSGLLDR